MTAATVGRMDRQWTVAGAAALPAQLALFLSASAGSTLIALSLPLFAPHGAE